MMVKSNITRMVDLAQRFIGDVLSIGGTAIDATAGKGHDTLFLAQRVGSQGTVYAFDVQKSALQLTSDLLRKHQALEQVRLIWDGHEHMARYVKEPVDACMFNLGYLPGSDKSIITNLPTTLKALRAALSLLRHGGRLSILNYPGHEGGKVEAQGVDDFCRVLPGQHYAVLRLTAHNSSAAAPFLIIVEKVGSTVESQKATNDTPVNKGAGD